MDRLVHAWWMLGAGILFFLSPVFLIGHLAMTLRDHRRHGRWPVTGLALLWPVVCVAMIGALEGSLSPPLFGVPLLLLLTTAWSGNDATFTLGISSYYGLSALVVVLSVLGEGSIDGRYAIFWPASAVLLVVWRRRRLAALAEAP